jgi:hypothetical protein
VHRGIKAVLAGKRYDAGDLARDRQHCSETERRADDATRDVEAWLKSYYMQDHVGDEFDGTISGVTNFGLFVTLDELYVDGLVHISDLGQDYFQFDAAKHCCAASAPACATSSAGACGASGAREPRAGEDRLRAGEPAAACSPDRADERREAPRLDKKMRSSTRSRNERKTSTGFHAVTSRLRQKPDTVSEIYIDAERSDGAPKDLRELAKRLERARDPVDAKRLDGMAGGVRHQGVVAQAEPLDMPKFIEDVLEGSRSRRCC